MILSFIVEIFFQLSFNIIGLGIITIIYLAICIKFDWDENEKR